MTDQAKAQAIVERLEKLTCADREVDAQVAIASGLPNVHFDWDDEHFDKFWYYGGPGDWEHVPRYTASIDAAVALVKKVKPGWRYAVEERTTGLCIAWVSDADDEPCVPETSTHPAHALLLALFRALGE